MIKKKQNKAVVDGLLRDWASRRAFRAGSLSDLEAKVMRNTRECLHERENTASLLASPYRQIEWPVFMRWVSWGTLAAAAVVLMLIRPFGEPPRLDKEGQDFAQSDAKPSVFSEKQLDARRLVYGELNDLFEGTLRWVSLTERDVQFDFDEEGVQPRTVPVVLRTIFSKRSEDGRSWESVWNMDVILPADEYVTLEKPDAPIPQLGLWVHQLPDGGFVVQTDFGGAGTLADSRMQTFLPGDPDVQMTSLHSGDTEYRVTQSLAVIAGEAS